LNPTLSSTLNLMAVLLFASAAQAGEPTPRDWFDAGRQAIKQAKSLTPINRRARNVILFVGDGMGISTITAARILDGQNKGGHGEENSLSFERFPYSALSKTYSIDQQTPDSAPTMTAMVTGIKAMDSELSVNQYTHRKEKDGAVVAANAMPTILERAKARGLSAGVVTTTRITHATPAATYAHTSERDWECDGDQPPGTSVKDIAAQLIDFRTGGGLDVVFGGGRAKFYPDSVEDPEYPGAKGCRKDGRNLIEDWKAGSRHGIYVHDLAGFDGIDPASARTPVMGLFERSHLHFEADRHLDKLGEPSLAEMTGKAIDLLARNHKGYFLMVEGGRIDHAHHAGNAYRALTDTIAFSQAVQRAVDRTDPRETLIIVTADHSHVLTIGGYPKRGNPILGLTTEPDETKPSLDLLGLPYTTLNYANGPGYTGASYANAEKTAVVQPAGSKHFPDPAGAEPPGPVVYDPANGRPNLAASHFPTTDPNYMQESTFPLKSETHGGEDVAIFAQGPKAHLLHGVVEQNVVYHLMAEALGF
jgi:alkaline phosphatase